jgi:pimeloyl-ACP methyl ester carboxylesterase
MTCFVLIPGSGGTAWYWNRVAPLLMAAGHEARPVDLPGDDETAGIREYADLVVPTAQDGDDVVLVAQSMGGFTAALVCEQISVAGLTFVNAMIPDPGETAGDWWADVDAVAERERWPAVPIRVLAGTDDRFFPVAFQRRVAEQRLGVTADALPGGHLIALSNPTGVANYLLS